MSIQYKYQEQFASALAKAWMDGKHEHVRNTIRTLKNKAQAAYIAAAVLRHLGNWQLEDGFLDFIHPNQGRT